MRRPALTVLICLLLVASAGCAGVLGGGSQTDEPATTQAPTQEVTTDAPPETSSGEQLAPGVSTDGVTDALALADTHREHLRDESFVKHASVERTNGSGSTHREATLQYANESHWNWTREGVRTFGVANGTFGLYADGERVLYTIRADGNTSYGVRRVSEDADAPPVPPADVFPSSVYARDLVYALFGSDDITVERGDDVAARVSGTASDTTLGETAVTNVEFSATVTEDGVVRSLDVAYEQGDRSVERTVTFNRTESSPVERPEWYAEASNQTA